MYGMLLLYGIIVSFFMDLNAHKNQSIKIKEVVARLAQSKLTTEEIDTIVKFRRLQNASTRFVEEEILLWVRGKLIRKALKREFFKDGDAYRWFGYFGSLGVREWNELKRKRTEELSFNIRKNINRRTHENQDQVIFFRGLQEWELRSVEEEKEENVEQCPICLQRMSPRKTVQTIKCEKPHLFHKECFDAYLDFHEKLDAENIFCPLCRAKLN